MSGPNKLSVFELFVADNRHNVFTELRRKGHDEDFLPQVAKCGTGELPGSPGKIAVMRLRVANGEEIWHPHDLVHGTLLLGKIRCLSPTSFGVSDDY